MLSTLDITLEPSVGLLDILPGFFTSLLTMEQLGKSCVCVIYKHTASQAVSGTVRSGDGPGDGTPGRVVVYVEGSQEGRDRRYIPIPSACKYHFGKYDTIWLLVESLGRVHDGGVILDQRKGIVGNVKACGRAQSIFSIFVSSRHNTSTQ